jgi:DNA repair exonuclease SbcCD ATPase subunit
MKGIRTRISNLRTNISSKLPEQEDLFGFPGINKSIIDESLEQSYQLLSLLESFDGKMEVTVLKRRLARLVEECNSLLKAINNSKNLEEHFDNLLINLFNIRTYIRLTYISLTEKPLRADTELQFAKEEHAKLVELNNETKDLQGALLESKESSAILIKSLETTVTIYEEKKNEILQSIAEIKSFEGNISDINDNVTTWRAELEKLKSDTVSNTTMVGSLLESANSVKASLESSSKELDSQRNQIKEMNEINSDQQKIIQATIEDANRFGLAGSFKKRKDELKNVQMFWRFVTILVLIALVVLSYELINKIINEPDSISLLVARIPIFASAVWLGWFSSKQHGYVSRIREDYAYKYAVSMAFEGYKNATRDIDEDLLKSLLQLTVLNISKSPGELYNSKNNHGSPLNEIIDKVLSNLPIHRKDESE